ncbi:MAG: hypothetical protein HFI69_01315 [Lachnospiraceae bacterium]|nr:hypothetical protein [Lachnospiraceae bacterium]
MRQHMKKAIPLLAAFLAVALAYFLPGQGTLAHAEEDDAGGTRAEAKVIELNTTYSEMINSGEDEDFFQFTTTVHGYFQVNFLHNTADSNDVGQGWNVNVLDGEGNVITSAAGIEKNWTSIVIPYAEPGKTFYVQVLAYNQYGYYPLNCVYDLTVNQTASQEWESEPNETIADADVICTDKVYHGITVNSSDEDYFKFTTTVRGYFQVNFSHNAADSNEVHQGWNVNVLDGKGTVITSAKGIEKNWTSIILPYAEPGKTFYVQVLAYNQYGYYPLNCMYDLKVTQKATADWESELNETMKTATAIKNGKTYNGITDASNDQDFYKLNISASGKLKVKFSSHNSNPSGSIGQGWDVVVYDKRSNEVTKAESIRQADSVSFDVKKGTYYIKIQPSSSWSTPYSCRYTLLADYVKAPSAPKISSLKAGKKAAAVKWKKASGANGYYVYRSTSKKDGFKKVQTLKKASALSWKNNKLKSGRRYYYKVAAYKKAKGMTVVSSYSAVKSVKVK